MRLVELTVPEREIPVSEETPDAVLLDILILIHAAFPPLHMAARMRLPY